jgi:hypothetical protein
MQLAGDTHRHQTSHAAMLLAAGVCPRRFNAFHIHTKPAGVCVWYLLASDSMVHTISTFGWCQQHPDRLLHSALPLQHPLCRCPLLLGLPGWLLPVLLTRFTAGSCILPGVLHGMGVRDPWSQGSVGWVVVFAGSGSPFVLQACM